MDPNANLTELIELLTLNPLQGTDEHDRIMELCDALFDWLYKGGFKPKFQPMPFPSIYLRSLGNRTYHIFSTADNKQWTLSKYRSDGRLVGTFIFT